MFHSIRKVVITGGAGFIGSHVITKLQKEGVPEIVVFDSLVSGSNENVPEGIPLTVGDINDIKTLTAAFQGATHIVHLAALVSVPASIKNPELTHLVNVIGFRNVLEAARLAKVSRVVYASSAAVYGDDPLLPKHEGLIPAPQSPYASSKVANELIAAEYEKMHTLSSVGLRFFNVYGPGQKGNHPYASVVPRFIDAIQTEGIIEVHGDGTQTRDFIHVRDVARAVYLALSVFPKNSGILNIASGTEVSLRELISIMESCLEKSIRIYTHEKRPGDIYRSVADISQARELLGFSPSITLKEGIQELV